MKIPDMQGKRALYDFLGAVSTVSKDFSSIWTVNITSRREITPKQLIKYYRDYRRTILARAPAQEPNSAFLSANGGQSN
jgi:hypothetical protein